MRTETLPDHLVEAHIFRPLLHEVPLGELTRAIMRHRGPLRAQLIRLLRAHKCALWPAPGETMWPRRRQFIAEGVDGAMLWPRYARDIMAHIFFLSGAPVPPELAPIAPSVAIMRMMRQLEEDVKYGNGLMRAR